MQPSDWSDQSDPSEKKPLMQPQSRGPNAYRDFPVMAFGYSGVKFVDQKRGRDYEKANIEPQNIEYRMSKFKKPRRGNFDIRSSIFDIRL